jgi:hypothetical protein
MTRFSPNLLCVPLVAAALLALGSCGGSSSETSPGDEAAAESKSPAARSNEPGPPDTFVPYRCSVCACRVFTGDGAYCNRPSCQHHWSDHQRPPE